MGDAQTSSIAATPQPTAQPNSDDEGVFSGDLQTAVVIVACLSVIGVLLGILIFAFIRLVKFIKSTKKLRSFMADAALAEFSRDGNPLYSPSRAPKPGSENGGELKISDLLPHKPDPCAGQLRDGQVQIAVVSDQALHECLKCDGSVEENERHSSDNETTTDSFQAQQ